MKRNSDSFRNSGAYTSPGTPEYGDINVGEIPKGWSSERVPLPSTSSSRRHIGAAALMPFNGGRALPSKWDDAERWITSPVSGFNNSFAPPPQRRPKSKSGPLAPQGLGYLSNYSPVLESGARNYMANSPLTTGVLVPEGLSVHYDAAKSNTFYAERNITRGTSLPGFSDSISSVPSSQDDKFEDTKEEDGVVSRIASRRDMATQMSPSGSAASSSKGRLSFSALSSIPTSIHQPGNSGGKDEIRDVQVDKGTTTSRQSKKQGFRKSRKDSANDEYLPSAWNVTEGAKDASKLEREEAKITAWENLQKAKAEAAIRKLEVKLEKKRSASMDKILNKLRASQMKAQAMRNSLMENQALQASRSYRRRASCCIHVKVCSLSNFFICCRKQSIA